MLTVTLVFFKWYKHVCERMWKSAQFKLYLILKRSRDCLLYTKKDRNCDLFAVKITACTTFTSRENVLNTSCYFYLPSILYEWKYTITWLLWNAMSRDANIEIKLPYFRSDRLQSTKTHIIIMATMKTGRFCPHSWFLWRLEGHWDTFWSFSISDVSVRELLHFWRWFSNFQLKLARPNYTNRKIETFERFFMMQKAPVKLSTAKSSL